MAGVGAAAVVEVFDPGGDPGADLVAGGEGTPVVVLGCEGGPQGFSHGVIPTHCVLPHRHGSFHGAHVGGQFLGSELRSPISMGHDPCREGASGGGDHVQHGNDQVDALLLAHCSAQDSTRVQAAPGRMPVHVQACEALTAHRRGDRPHTHIHARAHQSMADARSPIGATRHLMLLSRRLIQTLPHQRACPLQPWPSQ